MVRWWWVAAGGWIVLGALVPSGGASAQDFTGEVVDEFGAPLATVTVGLSNRSGDIVANTTSDANGLFSIRAPRDGTYRVHFTRQGYRSISGGPYDLRAVVALEARVVMHRAPDILDPLNVEVEGGAARLLASGFYERQKKGFGHFLDREEILRRSSIDVATALRQIPNIWVGRAHQLFGVDAVRHQTLVFKGGTLDCVPALYVDGSFIRPGGSQAPPLRVDDYVLLQDVEGIEFYGGPATVPIQFAHSGGCAVLVIWTRGGEDRGRAGF